MNRKRSADQYSFLSEESWRNILLSTLLPEQRAFGHTATEISLWQIGLPLIDIVAASTVAITENNVHVVGLLQRIEKIQNELWQWYSYWTGRFNILAGGTPTAFLKACCDNGYGKQLEFFVHNLTFMLICCRLHVALDGDEACLLEQTAQQLASSIVAFNKTNFQDLQSTHALTGLALAESTIATAKDWKVSHSRNTAQRVRHLVDAKIYDKWLVEGNSA